MRSWIMTATLSLSVVVTTMGAPLRGQGVWLPGFNHLPDNTGLSTPQVDPASHSMPGSQPSLWITENLPPTQQNPPGQRMNTVHVCLIPAGAHRGEVLVWDGNLTNYGVRTHQPWAIVNPYWPLPNPNLTVQPPTPHRFHNALLAMPVIGGVSQGELFCAGQCWMPDGRLLVCGGTKSYPSATQAGFEGTKFVYLWDHAAQPGDPFGKWYPMYPAELDTPRWYPTVTYDGTLSYRGIVIGGTHWTPAGPPHEVNSYEVVRPAFNSPSPVLSAPPLDLKTGGPTSPPWNPSLSSDRQYWGPDPAGPIFGDYPRIHALGVLDSIVSGGTAPRLFVSGFGAWGINLPHDLYNDPPFGQFIQQGTEYKLGQLAAGTDNEVRYGTSLLVPAPIGLISSHVARVGGYRGPVTNGPSNVVDTASINTGGFWKTSGPNSIPAMNHARVWGNVVLLPNGNWFAVGGWYAPFASNLIPELFDGTQWTDMAPHPGGRDYHAAAILLPDARVFVCGGEYRGSAPDYLIWEPPYFHLSEGSVQATGITVTNDRTNVVVPQNALFGMQYAENYRAEWTNDLESGITVDRVVLVRPAALTHHDDGGQRLVRLNAWDGGAEKTVFFQSPASILHAPPGWWMLFLVNSAGRPSLAYWVNLG